jgi:hypothetical protein
MRILLIVEWDVVKEMANSALDRLGGSGLCKGNSPRRGNGTGALLTSEFELPNETKPPSVYALSSSLIPSFYFLISSFLLLFNSFLPFTF